MSKKKGNSVYAAIWMKLEDMLSEISCSQKENYCMIPLICGT